VGHEMGHNFGLHHSRSNTCDASGCLIDEYGDDHDIMGAVTGHFNAYQKERLGWLDQGSSPSIQAVTGSGQYALEPYATPNGGLPKALRILKSTVGSTNTYLYAEARTQTGSDASLAPGVVIHTGVDNDGTQIYLQDLKPSTSTTDFILDAGQSVVGLRHRCERPCRSAPPRVQSNRGRRTSAGSLPNLPQLHRRSGDASSRERHRRW